MSLTSIISKKTDYNPKDNPLDMNIIRTIENGSQEYRILWSSYCDPQNIYVTEARDLYRDVAIELYNSVDKYYKKTQKLISPLKGIAVGICLGSLVFYNPRLVGLGALLYIGTDFIGKYVNESSAFLANLPEEKVLDSITCIKERAGQIIFDELKKDFSKLNE